MKRHAMQKPAANRWTYEDYLRLPDDGTRCEIIEGERLMTPAPWTRHQSALSRLFGMLSGFIEGQRLGRTFVAP